METPGERAPDGPDRETARRPDRQASAAPGTPAAGQPAAGQPVRHPGIARACFILNLMFAGFWLAYLLGPDALDLLGPERGGAAYRVFAAAFFALHFVLVSTGIIALFVVIIEIHARRPVRGFPSVLVALGLPMASFVYFAARYLLLVQRFLER